MRHIYFFFLILFLFSRLFSQTATKGPVGDKVATMIFAKYADRDFDTYIPEWQTNPDIMFPTMFSIPKLENPNEIESIEEYVIKNGSLSMYDYFAEAIPDYYSEMTNDKLNVIVNFEKNPERDDGLWVLDNISSYSTMDSVGVAINDVIDDYYYTVHGIDNYMQALLDDPNNIVCYNFKTVEAGISGSTYYNGEPCYSQHNGNLADLLAINVHELGHTMLNLRDTGNDYEFDDSPEYDAEINSNFAGRANTTNGPFSMMWHNTFLPSPYARYGLYSFTTNDMIRLGYIEDTDVELIEERVRENKTDVRIRAVSKAELGDKTAIRIPVTIDHKDGDLYHPSIGSGVESQYFLIEYRNTEMYDEISGLGYQGKSEGILITHIINSDTDMPTMDIEIATPYTRYWSNSIDLFRDPDSSITKNGIPYLNTNGDYYNGKKDVDWLDDLNKNPYSPEHGLGPYWKAPNAVNALSLPTDFFTGSVTGRNKFTPTTYPSSDSWKLKDTHIAVYMNGEDGEFAEITVYRNYWSKPISAETSEIIIGEGFVGENFTIETGAELILGENSIVSLVPNTNMVVQNSSKLKLLAGSELILEEGTNLTIEPYAIVEAEAGAEITIRGGRVRDLSNSLLSNFTLEQNYPNPFNPITKIRFTLLIRSDVKLNVYNINGQLVSELVSGVVNAGMHSLSFDASNLNSGMYFYTLEANGMSITKKMILTK